MNYAISTRLVSQPLSVAQRCLSDTSFARGIFLGELREQELFPYPDVLTQDQKETIGMMMESGHAFFQVGIIIHEFIKFKISVGMTLNFTLNRSGLYEADF